MIQETFLKMLIIFILKMPLGRQYFIPCLLSPPASILAIQKLFDH